jgi:putative transcriptional regulator
MKKEDFDDLVTSVKQAGRIRRGEMKPSRVTNHAAINVKLVRRRLGKSQAAFARMIGVSVATLQNWEQGRRRPDGPAQALLKVAAKNPEAVAAESGIQHDPSFGLADATVERKPATRAGRGQKTSETS